MSKSGYSVSAYLKLREKSPFPSQGVHTLVVGGQKRVLGLKALKKFQEVREGYSVFKELHANLREKPIGSRHTITTKSKKDVIRAYVYEKVTADEYKLVSRESSKGGNK